VTALDWLVISGYFVVMVGIGLWAKGRIHNVADFFTAGGKIPWWLSGISHHMSGYSAIMFVAFAAVAYNYGLAMYVWWALTIGLGVGIGAFVFAARWNRLRSKHGVVSPLEYLARRYNLPTQQVLAYSGALLKVVDIAAKWVAIAILLRGFAGVPIIWGILLTGSVTLVYITAGGLWADVLTDFGQFVIEAVAISAPSTVPVPAAAISESDTVYRADRTHFEVGAMLTPVSVGIEALVMFPLGEQWRLGVMGTVNATADTVDPGPLVGGGIELRRVGRGRKHWDFGPIGGVATVNSTEVVFGGFRIGRTWERAGHAMSLSLTPAFVRESGRSPLPGAWITLRWLFPI